MEQTKHEIVEDLKRILQISYSHCDDGNPNEADFANINDMAHQCLKKLECLAVQEFK